MYTLNFLLAIKVTNFEPEILLILITRQFKSLKERSMGPKVFDILI